MSREALRPKDLGYTPRMDRNDAMAVLRKHADALRTRGVRHAALFGSLARGEADAASDIDILIDLDPHAPLDVFGYVALKEYIAGLFLDRVDVVNREGLKPHLRDHVIRDAVYAF
jgi:uncharacterized protein